LLATLPAAIVSQAQVRDVQPQSSPIAVPKPYPQKIPTLGCCNCLGGENKLDLSTIPGNLWRVNGQPAAVVASPNPAWSTSTGGAKWISIDTAGNGAANTTYRYTLQFNVQKCTIPQTIVLKGLSIAADNRYSVYLTGPNSTASASPVVPCPAAAAATGHCFTPAGQLNNFAAWSITAPGVYTLNVDVANISGPSAMFLKAVLEGQCSRELVKNDK
jgi:hypothetical protein